MVQMGTETVSLEQAETGFYCRAKYRVVIDVTEASSLFDMFENFIKTFC